MRLVGRRVESRPAGALAALLGEARGDVDVERRQVRRGWSARTARGTRSRCRTGTGGPGSSDRPSSTISRRCSRRADRVVGVDAADALDGGLRDRLAVGDDRERLERRRREADGVGADVARDQRAGLGRGRELDAVAVDAAAGCPGRASDTSRSPSRASTVSRSVPASARSRGATADARRRTAGPRARPRSARSAAAPRASLVLGRRRARRAGCAGPRSSALASARPRSRERLQRLVERRVRGVLGHAGRGPLLGRRRRGPTIGPHGSACVDDDLASLHELEHREERDRDRRPGRERPRAGPGGRCVGAPRRASRMIVGALGRG